MSIQDYEKPNITTDIVMFRIYESPITNIRKRPEKRLQVLLIKREREPQIGKWSLPGGFVNIDEDFDGNICRKLKEKTGVEENFYREQLYTFGDINRDERGRVISVAYMGLCSQSNSEKWDMTDKPCDWFDIDEAKQMDLAFDHNKILEYALIRLKGKAEYTDILFNLLPDVFGVGDCQDVYEIVFGHPIDNFRRRVMKHMVSTGDVRKGKQCRPAELYRRKEGTE